MPVILSSDARASGPPCGPANDATITEARWPDVAHRWAQLGAPLRPGNRDVAVYRDAVNSWARTHGAPRALILGVTPELHGLPWPRGTHLLALDHTQNMIDAVWPGPRSAAIRGDWTALPLAVDSRDIVLCDGGITLMSYPHGHRKFINELSRAVAPGGLCIIRLFVPPKRKETPDVVLRELLEGGVANLNILKLRLGMSLQDDPAKGVSLGDVWSRLHEVAPEFESLASRIGWPLEHLLMINAYRDSAIRYCFLGVETVRHMFCDSPGGFELLRVESPAYELGERCPIIVLQRRRGTAPKPGVHQA